MMKNDKKFEWNERTFDASLRNSHSVTIPKIFEAANFLFFRQYTLFLDWLLKENVWKVPGNRQNATFKNIWDKN